MSNFEVIIYQKKDGIGYVTLNRPQRLNAYNIRMRDELYEVLGAIKDDPEVTPFAQNAEVRSGKLKPSSGNIVDRECYPSTAWACLKNTSSVVALLSPEEKVEKGILGKPE